MPNNEDIGLPDSVSISLATWDYGATPLNYLV